MKSRPLFGRLRNWRVIFILSIILRTYFAFSPSYIHPDEHFQGPEAVADQVFNWSTKKTWEFTSPQPIRSYFVLWTILGLPMSAFSLVFDSTDQHIDPSTIYYCLRIMFSLTSWILIEMAVERLSLNTKAERFKNIFFLATSYVSWTYQSHTFSNCTETVLVVWCCLIIYELDKTSILGRHADTALLGILMTFGVFNRITFPAFLVVPTFKLARHFICYPSTFLAFITMAAATAALAVYVDTAFYASTLTEGKSYVITPLNNLLYNTNAVNLSSHGLHLPIQHWLVNIPQLLGPGLFLLFLCPKYWTSLPFQAAAGGITLLSFIPHQEARFLLPAVPLLLCCIDIEYLSTRSKSLTTYFFSSWLAFNVFMGFLSGTFHQGGVVPGQIQFSKELTDAKSVIWWKTYPPPIWLLGKPYGTVITSEPDQTAIDQTEKFRPIFQHLSQENDNFNVLDLMSAPNEIVNKVISSSNDGTYLVAPDSSFKQNSYLLTNEKQGNLTKIWHTNKHMSLDHIDIGNLASLTPGLTIWRVDRRTSKSRVIRRR